MKREICVTLNLDVTDSAFEKYADYKKLNKGEIPDRNPTLDFKKQKSNEINLISNEINKCSANMIIGYGIWNLEDYELLNRKLLESGSTITKVFVPSVERREKILSQSLKEYSVHNRWVDYPPGYIEEQYEKSTKSIDELISVLSKTKVEIIPI